MTQAAASSIKKNSAFVKKLRSFGGPNQEKDQLLAELDKLDLTKFISEVASSIVEAKLKLSDLPAIVAICVKLHNSYKHFSKHLLDQYSRYSPTVKKKNLTGSHVDLRLFSELIIANLFPLNEAIPVLVNLLYYLMFCDENNFLNAKAILTFCKGYGEQFLGLAPGQCASKEGQASPASDLIPIKRQERLRSHVSEYYRSLVRHFEVLGTELSELTSKNNRIYKSRGELPKDVRETADAKRAHYSKLHDTLQQLGNLLGEPAPQINDSLSRESTPNKSPAAIESPVINHAESVLSLVSSDESLNNGLTGSDGIGGLSLPSSGLLMSSEVANRPQPEQYFTRLSDCVNRDMIDYAAIDFIRFFNTKSGRRKLVKTLFNVQRTRLDLLPLFARLSKTLYPHAPSVGQELASLLKKDFKTLFDKKDQINIESKVKNVRFIGELVKFDLFAKHEAINCLKILLSDFTHHHIEMTCNLLETCGRLLFTSPETHTQLKPLLEQMMRKKMLLSVDSKYVTMIENAYYSTNPPEVARQLVAEPPVHAYVRYLLYECLNRSSIHSVLQKLKKLDWNDKKLSKFVIGCMVEAYNINFYNIRYLAALLSSLNKDLPWVVTLVIDGVVEDILLMLEANEIHFNQRRIPMVRYFGELYNYRLSDASLVFKVLYLLITYGVHYPEPDQPPTQIPISHLDLPDNLFRIKLACDLLQTCGQHLNRGPTRRKLDCYLLLLQRYYWCKRYIFTMSPNCLARHGNQFPASVEYLFNDTIFDLRPQFQMATSYVEAVQALQKFASSLEEQQTTS